MSHGPGRKVRARLSGPMRVLLAPASPLADWLERLVAVQVVDRGVALGAQAFSTLFPLIIVYGEVVPGLDARDFATRIIQRFRLSGSAAQSVREALAPPSAVAHSSITTIGFVLVVVSSLSFARAVERLYELSYKLPAAGIRGTPWQLLWIALIPIYLGLRPLVAGLSGGWWRIGGSLLLAAAAWLSTPYLLLGRRIAWQRLVPGAALTAVGMTILSGVSLIYLPRSMTYSAQRYGTIGLAFALLGWLVITGFVLVGCTTAGAVADDRLEERR